MRHCAQLDACPPALPASPHRGISVATGGQMQSATRLPHPTAAKLTMTSQVLQPQG